jgi:putative endonuclease
MTDPRKQLGGRGEDLAAAALKKQGYRILERNYVTPLGEIDLIARQGRDLVFIEVKTRASLGFGAPQDAVSAPKQERLRRLADYYLKRKGLVEARVRFDVVGITINGANSHIEIFPDAF